MNQLGNQFKWLTASQVDQSKNLFKMDRVSAFWECVSVLRLRLNDKQRTNVQFLSEDKFKLAEIRKAYWCWLDDQYSSSQHDGTPKHDLHKRYKASHLLPILCAKSDKFADMILAHKDDPEKVDMLLSIADGSLTGHKQMSEYFDKCKQEETYL